MVTQLSDVRHLNKMDCLDIRQATDARDSLNSSLHRLAYYMWEQACKADTLLVVDD